MASNSRRDFGGIPEPPDTGNSELNRYLRILKENVELLCAQRGAEQNHAILRGDVTTSYPASLTGSNSTDIANLRSTLLRLMQALKGEIR